MQRLTLFVIALLTLFVAPRHIAGLGGGAWYDGDIDTQDALAQRVIRVVETQSGPTVYHTGMSRFDGQATIAIHQMALLGLGQIILAHPEKAKDYIPAMRASAKRLVDPKTLVYASQVYGGTALSEGRAYLGYNNLGLGMLRLVDPEMPAELVHEHDRITKFLATQLEASPTGLIETYPGESWPPDVAAVAGSIGLHARATKQDRTAMFERWAQRFEKCSLHPQTKMLLQRVRTGSCAPVDAPRGSGTAVGSYFLSFATPGLSKRLFDALDRTTVGGFGGIHEYAPGFDGKGDTNAGPIVFGISVGATGFGIGAARANKDRARFIELYRSARTLGLESGGVFAAGGALGNALLLAMLTAGAT